MPVKVKKVSIKGKSVFRVVESVSGKLVTRGGSAIDGGGHRKRSRAVAQVNAVNLSELRKKGRKGIPPALKRRRS